MKTILRSICMFFISMVVLTVSSQAHASMLLGSTLLNGNSGGSSVVSEYDFDIFISDGFLGGIPNTTLFDSLTLDNFDLGLIFESNAMNDPNFGTFSSYLMNGSSDVIVHTTGFGASTNSEASLFPGTMNGIDFGGYEIEKYRLVVDEILIDSPGQNPNDDGEWTDIRTTFTFSVYGRPIDDDPNAVVPEPASVLLFSSGLAGAFIRRKFSA